MIQDTGVDNTMLNGLVTKSPRFIWLPVVYANDRTVKGWQPIKKFVPGFITDEEYDIPASSDNGIYTNGNSISSFRVFTFNPAALPANEQSPIVDYDPTLGEPDLRPGGLARFPSTATSGARPLHRGRAPVVGPSVPAATVEA